MVRTLADNAGRITRLVGIIYDKEEQTKISLASFSADLAAAASTLTTSIQPVVEQAKADLDKYFPSSTKMLFRRTSPPGWKKLTDHTDGRLDDKRPNIMGRERVNAVSRAARRAQPWRV